MVKAISVQDFKDLQDSGDDYQLIDVREIHEFEEANLGGLHIPLADLPNQLDKVATDKKVIFHCKSGGRSAMACQIIQSKVPKARAYNLAGGIKAWAAKFDSSLTIS